MAQGSIFVFEADNADFKNRKRAARACASCQKRKKRCSHTFTKQPDQQAEKDTAEKVLPQLSHKEPIKFVGDLNPESVLTDLATSNTASNRHSRIGVWVEQSRLEQEQFRRQQEAAARNGNTTETEAAVKRNAAVQRYSKVERGRRTLTGHQKNYLQAVGALRVLPKTTQDVLLTTYVACIDPLFPIIDCKKLLQDYNNGEASVFLIQAICLVACKTEEAAPYLRLYEDGPLMDPIPFARALHTGLDAAVKADLEADRFTKVQIMTLMSLHNDGPGGIEESSMHLVMAIHDAQTTGLHINTPGRTPNDQAAMLWWTLWTLDKFNACLGGRPLMIADRDIDIGRPTLEPNVRSQTMAVWLAMGDLLDKVIEFYRPQADPDAAGWEADFPSFEAITEHCSLEQLSDLQRNLLEVCYNIIGILACRAGGPMSRSYNRRISSADRIQKLTAEGRQAKLPPLPLVPYAISLSLTVAYRGLRDSHCDPIKTQSDLAARCGILESLNKTWWTADAMAKLGRKALRNIQQPTQSNQSAEQSKDSSGLDVGDVLEAEVAPCKFGPFDAKGGNNKAASTSPGMANGSLTVPNNLTRTNSDGDNGLRVLSQAAAQLGQPRRGDNMNLSNITINDPNTINPRTTHITSNTNKRQRPNSDSSLANPHFGQHAFQTQPTNHNHNHLLIDTPPSTTNTIPTLTNTPAQTPITNPTTTMSLNTSNMKMLSHLHPNTGGVFEINPGLDPFCATLPESVQDSNIAPPPLQTSNSGTSNSNIYNPRLSVPLHYNFNSNNGNNNANIEFPQNYEFNELDTLFDGFFDLSMPTAFEDPLFEGASYDQFAFLTGGQHSTAGSVDLSQQQGGGQWQGQGQRDVQMDGTMG